MLGKIQVSAETVKFRSVFQYGKFVSYKRQVYTGGWKVELLEGAAALVETIIE